MTTVGIVGLGPMGTALLRALVGAGITVEGHDRDASARERAGWHGPVASSLPELARAHQVIVTSLPHEAAVQEVVTALSGDLADDAWVIETSTCGPDLAGRMQALLGDRSTFVDAPVSRASPDSVFYVGAAEGGLGPAEEPMRAVSRELVHCGGLGRGYALKLLNQVVKYGRFLAAGEALRAASRLGIDGDVAVAGLLAGTGADPGLGSAEEQASGRDDLVAARAAASTIAKDIQLARRMLASEGLDGGSFAPLGDFFDRVAASPWLDRPYPASLELLDDQFVNDETRNDADPL